MATNPFRNTVKPNWCPGCGHYGTHNSLQQALQQLSLQPEEVAIISGIGCAGRISGYMYAYGVHTTHGRALPFAQGVKLAHPDLEVIACGGDGDGFAIGLGHALHALKRNINMTYILMDNHVYGLTKGQTSPRSDLGFITKTTPKGNVENPLPALELALASGATFVAQAFAAQGSELVTLIKQAIEHQGFSFINVLSPCVTFNKINTYEWYKEHLQPIAALANYDPQNKLQAIQSVVEHHGLLTGLIYQDKLKPTYEQAIGLEKNNLINQVRKLEEPEFANLLDDFK